MHAARALCGGRVSARPLPVLMKERTMAQSAGRQFDERLLTHHPAGRACLDVCLANDWEPGSADVLRLVKLWDAVRRGERSEVALSPRRVEFARWLIEHGRLGAGDLDADDLAA